MIVSEVRAQAARFLDYFSPSVVASSRPIADLEWVGST